MQISMFKNAVLRGTLRVLQFTLPMGLEFSPYTPISVAFLGKIIVNFVKVETEIDALV